MRLTEVAGWVPVRTHRWSRVGPDLLRIGALCLLVCGWAGLAAQSGTKPGDTRDPASEVIQRMVQQNRLRAQHLKYFTSRRHYHVEFHGFGKTMSADMQAQVTYNAASGKTFQVIAESGSHLLLNHVLKKLLQTEQDDSQQQKAALTPANYNFQFQTREIENGRTLYVFAVEPKVKNKLLYRGRIWIDGDDYAVVRVEAQPAESPSFWIKSTDIHHVYAKDGEFWLPQTNRSESKIRLGGSALLTIDYGTYQFEEPHRTAPAEASELTAPKPLQDGR